MLSRIRISSLSLAHDDSQCSAKEYRSSRLRRWWWEVRRGRPAPSQSHHAVPAKWQHKQPCSHSRVLHPSTSSWGTGTRQQVKGTTTAYFFLLLFLFLWQQRLVIVIEITTRRWRRRTDQLNTNTIKVPLTLGERFVYWFYFELLSRSQVSIEEEEESATRHNGPLVHFICRSIAMSNVQVYQLRKHRQEPETVLI